MDLQNGASIAVVAIVRNTGNDRKKENHVNLVDL